MVQSGVKSTVFHVQIHNILHSLCMLCLIRFFCTTPMSLRVGSKPCVTFEV